MLKQKQGLKPAPFFLEQRPSANLPITIVSLLYHYQRYLFPYAINDYFILFIISAIYKFNSVSPPYLFLYVLPSPPPPPTPLTIYSQAKNRVTPGKPNE
jgi:hypothetical protein